MAPVEVFALHAPDDAELDALLGNWTARLRRDGRFVAVVAFPPTLTRSQEARITGWFERNRRELDEQLIGIAIVSPALRIRVRFRLATWVWMLAFPVRMHASIEAAVAWSEALDPNA